MPYQTPSKPCRLCGSKRVIDGKIAVNRGQHYIHIDFGIDMKPNAILNKERLFGGIDRCEVCLDCAEVRTFLANPEELAERYEQALKANGKA